MLRSLGVDLLKLFDSDKVSVGKCSAKLMEYLHLPSLTNFQKEGTAIYAATVMSDLWKRKRAVYVVSPELADVLNNMGMSSLRRNKSIQLSQLDYPAIEIQFPEGYFKEEGRSNRCIACFCRHNDEMLFIVIYENFDGSCSVSILPVGNGFSIYDSAMRPLAEPCIASKSLTKMEYCCLNAVLYFQSLNCNLKRGKDVGEDKKSLIVINAFLPKKKGRAFSNTSFLS